MFEAAYEKLCIAVVKQAAIDYRVALKRLRRNPKDSLAIRDRNDCEAFFEDEIELYTNLDGKMLTRKIRERVEAECNG